MTNIVHQTFDGYKILTLYYSVFLSIERINDNALEVNFIIIHLNTPKTIEGQGEYFPIINTPTKIQIVKQSQETVTYNLGNHGDDLIIGADIVSFSQNIEYLFAPASFDLIVNLIHINMDFRTA